LPAWSKTVAVYVDDDCQKVQTARRLPPVVIDVVVMLQVMDEPEPEQLQFALLWTFEIVANAGSGRSRKTQSAYFFTSRLHA
jgi:hypothetical protein